MTRTIFDQNQIGGTTLGIAQINTDFSGTSTSDAAVTGLSVTVNIPTGGRKVEIIFYCPSLSGTASGGNTQPTIWDGAVGSGTLLSRAVSPASQVNATPVYVSAIVTPGAGSKTYNIGYKNSTAGTTTVAATAASYGATGSYVLVRLI